MPETHPVCASAQLRDERSALRGTVPLPAARIDTAAVQPRERRDDLDRAKGLGIVLVVLGHVVAREFPPGNEWFVYVKHGLYDFHMPFFMYLSGYVAFMTGAARAAPSSWPALFGKRAVRLLVPFMLFGVAIAVGKSALASHVHMDNRPTTLLQELADLVWNTEHSVALSVWYLAVLFLLSCATPILLWLVRGNTLLLLGIATFVYFLPVPAVLYLNRAAMFFVFFVVGGVAADAGRRWLDAMDRTTWASLAALAALVCVCLVYWQIGALLSLLVCGIVSMPALHGLVRKRPWARSQLLLQLGAFSLVIYLLNTPFIGLVKALMWKVAPWDGLNFFVYLPVLLAAGIGLPILVKKWVFSRVPAIDRMTQ